MANALIIASAIKFCLTDTPEYFHIVTGKRHSDCFLTMEKMGWDYIKDSCELGFFTDEYEFLNRNDAGSLAYINGQAKEFHRPLDSEDLW